MFVQKSPFPTFEKREKYKISLCKGRFRGIFNLPNTTLTSPLLSHLGARFSRFELGDPVVVNRCSVTRSSFDDCKLFDLTGEIARRKNESRADG